MKNHQASFDWSFWRRYVLSCTLGYGIGGILGWAIPSSIWIFFIPESIGWDLTLNLSMAGGGFIAGVLVGLAQWRAIRSKAPRASKLTWIAGNMMSMAISWTAFFWISPLLRSSEPKITAYLVGGVLWGFLAGAIQWHIFQGRIQRASLWFALNSLIGIIVFGIGWAWLYILYSGVSEKPWAIIIGTIYSLISWPLAGVLAGVTTGGLLIWLFRPPKREA